jgi:hypothetical protein
MEMMVRDMEEVTGGKVTRPAETGHAAGSRIGI